MPVETVVKLTWSDVWHAAQVGLTRHVAAMKAGRSMGECKNGWQSHIEGACGELAVAKALNVHWTAAINTFKQGSDVGHDWQVRTRSRNDYELLVRDDDPDDVPFILVTGTAPTFTVVGWLLGREAKRPEWRRRHGGRAPAYFPPVSALHPLEDLFA